MRVEAFATAGRILRSRILGVDDIECRVSAWEYMCGGCLRECVLAPPGLVSASRMSWAVPALRGDGALRPAGRGVPRRSAVGGRRGGFAREVLLSFVFCTLGGNLGVYFAGARL